MARKSKKSVVPDELPIADQELQIIADIFPAVVLSTMDRDNIGARVRPEAFFNYMKHMLAESAQTKDPVERMMLEQMAWAHHAVGNLHLKATTANNPELAISYQEAAARTMAEIRKMALALRVYRSPNASQQVTLVGQQNIAAGDQQVALVAADIPPPSKKIITDNKQSTKEHSYVVHNAAEHTESFAPSNSWQGQSEKATGNNGCGSGEAPLDHFALETMAEVDGTEVFSR